MARRKPHDDFDDDAQRSGFFGTLFKWLFVMAIWGGIALSCVLVWYGRDLIDLTKKSNFERKRSVIVLANDGQTVLANFGETTGTSIKVSELPPYVGNAVLAIEDRRFRYHMGVDPVGLVRAAVTNWRAGHIVQGGSTITQQLAKNLFLKPERTLKRKIQEAMLAVWLEFKYTKDEILSSYLNRVYFGAGAYGIDAAARVYFGKPAEQLTLEEAAMLAGLLKAPSRLSPETNPDRALARMQMVLGAMEEFGFIDASKKKADTGTKNGRPTPPRKPISLRSTSDSSRYFADWVLDRANELIGISGADLKIVTTLDPKVERAAQEAIRVSIDLFFKDAKKKPQAALVVLDRDGAIRAMIGGTNYRESQYNRATQAMRQPGSSFKPFVYLAALEKGWRPGDPIEDAPIQLGSYNPGNHDGQYYGPVPLSTAMALSLNTAAVRMATEVGIDAVIDVAHRAGIVSDLVPNYSVALGTSEVTILEMASAYNTIANYGVPTVAYGIVSIRDSENDILYKNESVQEPPVLDGDACKRLIAMMQEVVTRGTGGRAYPGFAVAGKTGTSSDYRDTWFVGMSGTAVAAVWVGHDDNTQMRKQYGGNAPADIFRQVIQAAQENRTPVPLTDADPYEMSFGSAFETNGLSGVFSRVFGDSEENAPASQPVRGGQRMKPILESGSFND